MKMFVVLALAAVAVAEPEADPQVFLSGAYSSPLEYTQLLLPLRPTRLLLLSPTKSPTTTAPATTLHTTYAGTPVVKPNGAAHAVAVTPFGVAHSSHVGVCTNNNGEQVSC